MGPASKSVLWIMTNDSKLDIGKRMALLDMFSSTIRYFCVQATWSVPSACSDVCIPWKMFMGMRTGIHKTIKRNVKRNKREWGIARTTVCHCLFERNVSSVQYSSVQFSTVQFSTVQFSSVQYSTVQFSTVQFSTVHVQN